MLCYVKPFLYDLFTRITTIEIYLVVNYEIFYKELTRWWNKILASIKHYLKYTLPYTLQNIYTQDKKMKVLII